MQEKTEYQQWVNDALDVINEPHGIVTAKRCIGNKISKGEQGKITAYLPEEETFAVFFDDERWACFHMDEDEFNETFEVELYDYE